MAYLNFKPLLKKGNFINVNICKNLKITFKTYKGKTIIYTYGKCKTFKFTMSYTILKK